VAPPGNPPTLLDHFRCYPFVADDDDDDDDDDDPHGYHAADRGAQGSVHGTVRVRRPVVLCNPWKDARGNGQSDRKPGRASVCYAISGARLAGNVNVRNQFDDATLRVRRPASLCVPSKKRELPPPLPDDA
jgi:hypothetical protein